MSVWATTRKELTDGRRSPLLWALVALIGVYTVPIVLRLNDRLVPSGGQFERVTVAVLVSYERPVVLAAILVGSLAVAGERASGSLRLLLGSSARRRDVLAGKLLGRGALLVGVILASQLLVAAALFARLGVLSTSGFVFGTVLTVLFALSYFGIAVGVSTAVATPLRALAGSLGVYVFFDGYWEPVVVEPLYYLLHGRFPVGNEVGYVAHAGDLHDLVQRLNPNNAYTAASVFQGPADWFAVGVLLAWFAVPVALGYVRFRTAETAGADSRSPSRLTQFVQQFVPNRPSLPLPTVPTRERPLLALVSRELTDLSRSRLLLGLFGVLVLGAVQAATGVPAEDEAVAEALRTGFTGLQLLTFLAILLGAFALVGESETGHSRVVLGFPVRRRNLFVAKAFTRGLVYGAAAVTASLVGGVVLFVRLGSVEFAALALGVGRNVALGLAYFGLAVGVSTFARTRIVSLGTSLGASLLFSYAWEVLVVGPPYLLRNGRLPRAGDLLFDPASGLQWDTVLNWVSPDRAYRALGTVPADLRWIPATALLCWTVVPLVVGYWRFRGRDIA